MDHTPGPWGYFIDDDRGPIHFQGTYVVDQLCGSNEWISNRILKESDARLIAAAPELLEICKKLLDWGRDHISPVHNPEANVLLIKAHTAINKATGEQA